MVEIEFMDKLNDDIKELIDYEFDKYAEKWSEERLQEI